MKQLEKKLVTWLLTLAMALSTCSGLIFGGAITALAAESVIPNAEEETGWLFDAENEEDIEESLEDIIEDQEVEEELLEGTVSLLEEEDISDPVTINDENLRKVIAQNLGLEYTEGISI